MIDTSSHHLVYGKLTDFITGTTLKDTDDERIRQKLAKFLINDLGYKKSEIEPRLTINTIFNNNRVKTTIDFTICIKKKRLFIIRYGPGSLISREKAAISAARVLDEKYRIPLAIVTNGYDAKLIETKKGKVLSKGMSSIPDRTKAEILIKKMEFIAYNNLVKREMALRVLNVFDQEVCCIGTKC